MKNSETERDFTELIKSTLDNYHEDYIPGAWESFDKKRKRKKTVILLRNISAVAACLLIGWLGFHSIYPEKSDKPENTVVQNNLEAPANNDTNLKGDNESDITARIQGAAESVVPSKEIARTVVIRNQHVETPQQSDSTIYEIIPGKPAESLSEKAIASSQTISDSVNRPVEKKTPETQGYKPIEDRISNLPVAENSNREGKKLKIRIGVNFSPGVNSTQTGSAFNYSGGINTDIALFPNIQLSTGLQIEHQSVVNGDNIQGQTKADLVNLDLPVNLTWKFFTDKSRSFYLSGGVSSLAYLSEKYDKTTFSRQIVELRTMSAGVESLDYQVEGIKSTTQSTESSFNSFDIAGRVNILFGMEQRLSPKLSLHIEPYVKIPVSGLATENLRFSTGGVTCKISF